MACCHTHESPRFRVMSMGGPDFWFLLLRRGPAGLGKLLMVLVQDRAHDLSDPRVVHVTQVRERDSRRRMQRSKALAGEQDNPALLGKPPERLRRPLAGAPHIGARP